MAAIDDEQLLIERAVAGDTAAVWQLLCQASPRLLSYIDRHLPPELRGDLDPHDLLQDVYFRAFRGIAQFVAQGDDSVFRWLATIARNLMTDALRRPRNARPGAHGRPEADESMIEMINTLAVHRRTPSRSAMGHEWVAILESSMRRLPEEYRTAPHLRHIEGLDIDEAALRMNRSPGSLQMLCCRALKALRLEMRTASLYI